jgi:uncharacterized protein
MPHKEYLGCRVQLKVLRFTPHGAFLSLDAEADDESPSILLPGGEIPTGTNVGDPLDVFVYLDSEDRPIVTTHEPLLSLGQVAFLKVSDLTDIGAFMDWGLAKELLLPYGEHTREIHIDERHPVGLTIDNTGRLLGTMRVTEMLKEVPPFKVGEWVHGEAWRRDPELGAFIIVERQYVGLLPIDEADSLARGQPGMFRVTRVQQDGKIDLSLRREPRDQTTDDGELILAHLDREGAPQIGDSLSPDRIRELFGLSKKAFKRAVGGLLRQRAVRVGEDGYLVRVTPSPESEAPDGEAPDGEAPAK